MAASDEAELLQDLRRGFEQGEIEGPLVSTAGKHVGTIFKEFKQSSNKVNDLLEEVFLLESRIEVCSHYEFFASNCCCLVPNYGSSMANAYTCLACLLLLVYLAAKCRHPCIPLVANMFVISSSSLVCAQRAFA